jgi:VWFA-related protein
VRLHVATLGISIWLLAPSGLLAIPQAPANSAANTAPQTSQVIRSTTRLVQVSVVVQDKKGNPITGLRKEDFTILDEGKRQDIAFFASSAPARTTPSLLPSNVFTNRYDLKGEDPGAVTIVLFDWLNTSVDDQAFVRQQVLRFLQTLKPQDHVAFYALTTQLLILHEFTQDASALVDAVNHFTPQQLAAFDASHPVKYHVAALAGDAFWARFEDAINNISGKIADANTISRVGTTAGAIEAIADHVAGIPGRKSLVWVSGGFPIQIGIPTIGVGEDQYQTDTTNQLPRTDRYAGSYAEDVRAAADALNRVNMAMYTVDAHGVAPTTGLDPALINGGLSQNTYALNAEQDTRASSRLLADRTGGLAFFGSIGIDPKQLLLESSKEHRTGAVDLFFVQRDEAGKIIASENQHVVLNLEEKQYAYMADAAMVLDRHLTIMPETTEIRVVVRDSGSGALGSVTVPVKAFLPIGVNPPTPAN